MRCRSLRTALTAAHLATVLASCAWGAVITPSTPLERAVNGTYEGIGVGGTGRVPYRLILTVQEREGRAAGALTNLESRKAYAVTGTFRRTPDGGFLELNLYENGDRHRGNIHGQVQGAQLTGTLRTVLLEREWLGYTLNLRRLNAPPDSPGP